MNGVEGGEFSGSYKKGSGRETAMTLGYGAG